MKRYKINARSLTIINSDHEVIDSTLTVEENSTGDWVRWSDVKELRKNLLQEITAHIVHKLMKGMK